MNLETYNALTASIKKWQKNAQSPVEFGKVRESDCPLCDLFLPQTEDCNGCPVKDATGYKHCYNTPYQDAYQAFIQNNSDDWKKAAQSEADFLAALVPAGGPDE